jgi:hypothetical protein
MKNKSEKIDKYFKERFEQFEQLPSETVWNNLATKLGHNRKKGMVVLTFRIAAGMALIFSLGLGFYLINGSKNHVNTPVISVNKSADVVSNAVAEHPGVDNKHTSLKPIKKLSKSKHLEPARKVYIGQPVVRRENFGALQPKYQGLIPVDLPVELSVRSSSSSPAVTPEETIAWLLPETEAPVESTAPKQNHWSLGSEFAPLYSYRTITSDNLESDKINSLNASENGMLAYAGGMRVALSAGRRLSVQSGVYYSRYGQEKTHIETFGYNNTEVTASETSRNTYLAVSNSTGVIYSDQPENAGYDKIIYGATSTSTDQNSFPGLNGFNTTFLTPTEESDITIKQIFDYLEIPLTVKYKIIDRRFNFSLSGGLITNFLVGNVVNLEQNGEKTKFGKTDEINQVNYLGSFGLGFEYPLVSGFAFSIEPRFRYYLNPIDKSSQINVHPYSFGFFAGISYNF